MGHEFRDEESKIFLDQIGRKGLVKVRSLTIVPIVPPTVEKLPIRDGFMGVGASKFRCDNDPIDPVWWGVFVNPPGCTVGNLVVFGHWVDEAASVHVMVIAQIKSLHGGANLAPLRGDILFWMWLENLRFGKVSRPVPHWLNNGLVHYNCRA